MTNLAAKQLADDVGALWYTEHDGDLFCVAPLIFHVSLLINPKPFGGYDDRYCYHNPFIAIKAVNEFINTGQMRYWKKHHTKNISIIGNHAYPPGVKQIPENALHVVDWDITDYENLYPYDGLLSPS